MTEDHIDWDDDPQQLAEVTQAAGLHPDHPLAQEPRLRRRGAANMPEDPDRPRRKQPCEGHQERMRTEMLPPMEEIKASQKARAARHALTSHEEVKENLQRLGATTLDGFTKLSRRIAVLEEHVKPSSLTLSALGKVFLILTLGFVATIALLTAGSIAYALLMR